jgi:putative ABC transport system permease protein
MPLHDGFRRAFHLRHRGRLTSEVSEEFAFHLEMRARELRARGYSEAAAREEALRQFGDLPDAIAYCRAADARRESTQMRVELLSDIRQDVRYALRSLRKAPGFATVAILTLALGIGANTAIFSVVNGVLLEALPFPEPERLVMVHQTFEEQATTSSPTNFYDWRAQSRSFAGMTIMNNTSVNLTAPGAAPERLRAASVAASFFSVLRVPAIVGRTFNPDEDSFGGPNVVVLHERFWRSRFNADPRLVGRTITLNGQPHTVVGIVGAESAWPSRTDLWIPLRFDPVSLPNMRGAIWLTAVARLAPGVTMEAAAAEMATIAGRLEQQYPRANTGVGVMLEPMREYLVGDMRTPLLVLLGAVGFVLLIACANVSNLMLVRATARETELAVRTALGAGRARLVRQLMTESTLLALLGGVAGLALATWGTKALVGIAPRNIPRLNTVSVDTMVLMFTLAIALGTGILFGLIPAMHVAGGDVNRTLKEGGRGARGHSGSGRTRSLLVVSEMALAVMLLAGAGLLIRSFRELMQVDPGFRAQNVASFTLSLPETKYEEYDRQRAFMDGLLERLRALPGVQSVAGAQALPLTGLGFTLSFDVAGRPEAAPGQEPSAEIRVVTPDYLATLGIPIVRGRGFTEQDRQGSHRVLLMNEAGAARFFAGEEAIGQRIDFGWSRDSVRMGGEVVGIVHDVREQELAGEPQPQFYVPFAQWPVDYFSVALRTDRSLDAIIPLARTELRELDPDLPMFEVQTLESIVADSVARPRFYMLLLGTFAIVALVLSGVGIYGVIAYLVAQRTHEIGVRMALGASSTRVIRMVLGESLAIAAVGIALGLAGAFMLTRLLSSLLFGVNPTDPLTFTAVALILAAIAMLASWLPAMRAARLEPVMAMRAE